MKYKNLIIKCSNDEEFRRLQETHGLRITLEVILF